MSIAPLALSLALLLFWTGLGWSLIALIEPRVKPTDAFLVAPMCGVAATLLPVFWLSSLGLPVATFARPLAAGLILCILAAWIWRRPGWTYKDWAFALPVVLAVIVIGFPSLTYGFNWVANGNDDWANYNLSATRYLANGLYQRPSIAALASGRDYPGFLWFLEVALDGRPGADLLLAWVSSVVGRNPFFVFMPVILAFHGVLCFAACAVASRSLGQRRALLIGLVLTALSPLSLYAVHQQLIAQVLGVAFMCGISSLTFVSLTEATSVRRLALSAILVAAYAVVYPETIPFYGLAFILFHALHIADRNWGWSRVWRFGLIVPAIAVILGPYTVSLFYYILNQFEYSASQGVYNGVSLFPYFIIPSGLAVLFGFSVLGTSQSGLLLSLGIAGGLFIICLITAGTVVGIRRRSVTSVYILVIALVTFLLARGRNDFGLFKLAMFAQPFVWFALIAFFTRFRTPLIWLFVGIVAGATSVTNINYLQNAMDESGGRGKGILGASSTHLLETVFGKHESIGCEVNIETPLPPLAKILAGQPGCARSFISRTMPLLHVSDYAVKRSSQDPLHYTSGVVDFTRQARDALRRKEVRLAFPTTHGDVLVAKTSRPQVEFAKPGLVRSFDSVFNERGVQLTGGRANELVFMDSSLGMHYYLPEIPTISVYGEEQDPFNLDRKFAAVGRYLLFRVESPTRKVRLMLDFTTSLLRDGRESLPSAVAMGETAVAVGLLGHGAGRVISPEFAPLSVDGISYVLLDLGEDPKLLPTPRVGLMRLYGTQIPIDYRRLVGFARQIRLVDAEGVQGVAAPSSISRFPEDLKNPNLRYSGLYEDGWMGDRGFIALHSNRAGVAVLQGEVPAGLGLEGMDLEVRVNDGTPTSKHLMAGRFRVEVPAGGLSRIAFRFSKVGRLPGGDDRPVSARLISVAVEEEPTSASLGHDNSVPEVLRQAGSHYEGLDKDGWLSSKGFIEVHADHDGEVVLRGVVPGGIGLAEQRLKIRVGYGQTIEQALAEGDFRIVLPVKAGTSIVGFTFDKEATLPGSDGRRVAALLKEVSVAGPRARADGAATSPEQSPAVPGVLRKVGTRYEGIHQDGWMAAKGFIEMHAAHDGEVVFRGMVPGGVGLARQHVSLTSGNGKVIEQALAEGDFRIVLPVKAGTSTVGFSFDKEATLPGPDGRRVAALLKEIVSVASE